MRPGIILLIHLLLAYSCVHSGKPDYIHQTTDTVQDAAGRKTAILTPTDGTDSMNVIHTGNTTPRQLINFANTAIGIPYRYASADPKTGFDCSGFITYTFNHFGIAVPRTSVDFTNMKHEVTLQTACPGDLILFTGTDSNIRTVGHMGIITEVSGDSLKFIHATSGHANGVTISLLNAGYKKRFVKVVRVFPQNEH